MSLTEQEIVGALGMIVYEVTDIPAAEVTLDKRFVQDLDIDSLAMAEILVEAHSKFGIEIPDERLRELSTVKDIVAYIQQEQEVAR
ncbi:acyl carrier protein [Streptosporangium sp. NPDC051023]|uniref:acyl carrier protein n=1 Tax=Streptosporangium sp. NPDC051023 TaxID=3155410 RepID=UPI00344FB99F